MTSQADTDVAVMIKRGKASLVDCSSTEDNDSTSTPPRTKSYYTKKVGELSVYVLQGDTSPHDVIRDIVGTYDVHDIEKPIYCTNLDDVIHQHKIWKHELPNVEVFYAVKTYDSPVIIQLLHNLGCGFEVASKTEVAHCLQVGVPASKILCDHPYKFSPHLQYYATTQVRMLTVDSPDELEKIAQIYPDSDLLLRIIPADDNVEEGLQLDAKFGCTEEQAQELLEKGRQLGLNFIGVAFHVGSATKDATVHSRSLALARRLFDYGKSVGYDFTILDIGGGFPGGKNTIEHFREICSELRPALDEYFPAEMRVRVVAEPGRYFATIAATTYASVIGRRKIARAKLLRYMKAEEIENGTDHQYIDDMSLDSFIYVLNDGVWNSMNFILAESDHQPLMVLNPRKGAAISPCIMWGPTCDCLDRLSGIYNVEELRIGDWVYRRDSGAYGHTIRGNFNGMPHPKFVFTIHESNLYLVDKTGIMMPYL